MRFENAELRALRAVVEEGGFKRAADVLHLSQSAVSQSVASLEDKLGSVLLERGPSGRRSGIRLTPAGKRVFDHAVEVLRGEEATLEELDRLREGSAAPLSLALSSSVNRFYAPQLLSLYHQAHPSARMHIRELPSRDIIYAVLTGSVELGLGPFQKHMPAFEQYPLFNDTRHLVVSPLHRDFDAVLAGDARALKRTPLIASALDNPELRPSIQRLRDQFATVWEVSSLSLRIHMVSQGMGLTFMDGKVLAEHPSCRNLKIVDHLSFGRIDKQVGLYCRRGVSLSSGAQRFIALCENYWQVSGGEQS